MKLVRHLKSGLIIRVTNPTREWVGDVDAILAEWPGDTLVRFRTPEQIVSGERKVSVTPELTGVLERKAAECSPPA